MKLFKITTVWIVWMLVAGVVGLHAEETGIIAGKVTDSLGNPLVDVTVRVTGDQIAGNRMTKTSETGTYRFPGLPVGIYTLVAEMNGMKSVTQTNIKVTANTTSCTKLLMMPETVSVIDEKGVTEELPESDDLFSAFRMSGGITGGGCVRVHGGAVTDDVYLFDGVDTTDPVTSTFGAALSSDSISEVEVQSGGFVAEYGRSSGGIVNAVTKSGDYSPETVLLPLGKSTTTENEDYDAVESNRFQNVFAEPLSTFSIDVDTASYANARRFLVNGKMPPANSIRIEELVNYFNYDYPHPHDHEGAFEVCYEVSDCPWNPRNRLVHIGIQGKEIDMDDAPEGNFVFLVDVSGSMDDPDKLPLLKKGLKLMVNELDEHDTVAMVTYAGYQSLALPATSGSNKGTILKAIDDLGAGGGTAGADGIRMAYDIALKNFIDNGNNRIILATDGDFNIGISKDEELIKLIEEKRKSGVFISTLGFGTGNLKDSKLEKIANHGNGNYSYIDTILEAQKVLVDEMGGTMITIAKDVKLQVEFNPAMVDSYRLIGYENRVLATEDFHDDTKDAGELGSGHTVTALYEIVPATKDLENDGKLSLRYQTRDISDLALNDRELLILKMRYKEPNGDTSSLIEMPLEDDSVRLQDTTDDYRFSAAVALFGMLLRQSEYTGNGDYDMVLELARNSLSVDEFGYRAEFIELVEEAMLLSEAVK